MTLRNHLREWSLIMPNLTLQDLVQLGRNLAEQQPNRVRHQEDTSYQIDYKMICQFLEYEILELYAKNPTNPIVQDFIQRVTSKLQRNLQR